MIALDLRTRFGRLQAKLGVPDRPIRLAELAWNALSLDERLLAAAVKTDLADGTKTISCTKGCGACCRQLVPLSPPEAWMLADVVRSMPQERRDAVLDRFAKVNEALNQSPLFARELSHESAPGEAEELALQFFELGQPCPFLEDESCSIHPQRPSVCREFLVTSPASDCAQLRTKKQRRVPTAMRMSEALSRVTAKLLERPIEIVPLHIALDWALAHEEEGKRTFEARTLLETFFEEVQRCQLGVDVPTP